MLAKPDDPLPPTTPPTICAIVFKVGCESSIIPPAISLPALPPNPPTTLTTGAFAPDIATIPAGNAFDKTLATPPPVAKPDANLAYSIGFCSDSDGCCKPK